MVGRAAIDGNEMMTKGGEVTEAAWFELDELPPASEFAHNGWGRAVLLKLAKIPAQ